MKETDDRYASGRFEPRYLAFLETVATLRPSLHRYCARMTGSVTEGEDIVQQALFDAYRGLESYDESRPLKAWLFRIAHNRCIDFLRHRGVQDEIAAQVEFEHATAVDPVEPVGPALGRAVEYLVLTLPPMERACVLLKDVLDYSLVEIAELVDSTVGGVKAALNRGRAKLTAISSGDVPTRAASAELSRLLHLYVERFNLRDWVGLRDLIAADARLCVGDRYAGPVAGSPYFGQYERMAMPWRAVVARVDGELAIVTQHEHHGEWLPHSVIQLEAAGDRVGRILDFEHCRWVLGAASSIVIES